MVFSADKFLKISWLLPLLCLSVCFYRLDSCNYVSEREIQFRLMDVLQESQFSGADRSPCPRDTSENGRCSYV